jgi:predicted ArsR family transcriptional regulator
MRRRLLAMLRDRQPGRDAHELADALGLHVTTVRSHLQILERAGLVVSRPRPQGRSGRPRTVYTATEAPFEDRVRQELDAYQQLTAVLAAHLEDTTEGRAARAEQAGVTWAATMDPAAPHASDETDAAARVGRLCDALGFAPDLVPEGDGWRIDLRACPFRRVARAHPEVVCAVHQGLIRGTLERAGFSTMGSRLRPFVEPEHCVAHLGPAATAAL